MWRDMCIGNCVGSLLHNRWRFHQIWSDPESGSVGNSWTITESFGYLGTQM